MDALNGVFIMPRFNGLVELRAGGNTPLGAKSHKAAGVFGKQADLEFAMPLKRSRTAFKDGTPSGCISLSA